MPLMSEMREDKLFCIEHGLPIKGALVGGVFEGTLTTDTTVEEACFCICTECLTKWRLNMRGGIEAAKVREYKLRLHDSLDEVDREEQCGSEGSEQTG